MQPQENRKGHIRRGMDNPLSVKDPSGYLWLFKGLKKIGRWFKQNWRPVVVAIVGASSTMEVFSLGWLRSLNREQIGTRHGMFGRICHFEAVESTRNPQLVFRRKSGAEPCGAQGAGCANVKITLAFGKGAFIRRA